LHQWVANKEKIIAQPKGLYRYRRKYTLPQELILESELYAEFEKAQEQGCKISYKLILRHAKNIYSRIHPDRVCHGAKAKYAVRTLVFDTRRIN
jgi:hypothetical protein